MNDRVETAMTEFFRQEMPREFAPPAVELAVPTRRSSALRSRLTLASAAALLLGLGLWLSSGHVRPTPKTPSEGAPGLLRDSTADGSKLLNKLKP